MDRRSFAKGLLGSIIASAAGANYRAREPNNPFELVPYEVKESSLPPDYDIAVVGGGVSGIYTAWRLITANPSTVVLSGRSPGGSNKLKVAVFEGSDRIGGRLLSASHMDLPGVRCDLGGMRFLSSQKRVGALVKKLGLAAPVMNTTGNIAFLRGKYLSWSDLSNPDLLPYELEADEKQCVREGGAGALIAYAIYKLLPKTKDLYDKALYECLQSSQFEGRPLFEWGFRDLLAKGVSSEALSLGKATSGFDALGENANAVDLIRENLDFEPGTTYFVINDGFEAVPWALQEKFEAAGGKVFFGKWLSQFEVVKGADGNRVRLKFHSGCESVTARAIILAMPRRCLQLLLPSFAVLDNRNRFATLLDTVEPIPLFKMFLLYPQPWWQDVRIRGRGVCSGRSYTDTPIRQCWYWNSAGCGAGDSKAMIMAYCDMSSVEFWGRLRASGAERLLLPNQCENAVPPEIIEDRLVHNWMDHQVPEPMLAEMHRQLLLLHGVDSRRAPRPIAGSYMDWCDEPYGCAVHFWNRGCKSWELVERMIQPIQDVPCYICGEAFSTNQTWVEGALQTADILLKKLGLKPL